MKNIEVYEEPFVSGNKMMTFKEVQLQSILIKL